MCIAGPPHRQPSNDERAKQQRTNTAKLNMVRAQREHKQAKNKYNNAAPDYLSFTTDFLNS